MLGRSLSLAGSIPSYPPQSHHPPWGCTLSRSPFLCSPQTAPSVTRRIGVLLPPDSKHTLGHLGTYFCSLTLLLYLGTVAMPPCPAHARLHMPNLKVPYVYPPHEGHTHTEGHTQTWAALGLPHRYRPDSSLCHLRCHKDKVLCPGTHVMYIQDPPERLQCIRGLLQV